MSTYHFIAVDTEGKQHKGFLEGDSRRHIQQQLKQRQWTPLTIDACNDKSGKIFGRQLFKRYHSLKMSEVTLLTRQLATLIAAAVPIEAALATVAAQSNTTQRRSSSAIL